MTNTIVININKNDLVKVRDKILDLYTQYLTLCKQCQLPINYDFLNDYDFIFTKLKFGDIVESQHNDTSKQNKK